MINALLFAAYGRADALPARPVIEKRDQPSRSAELMRNAIQYLASGIVIAAALMITFVSAADYYKERTSTKNPEKRKLPSRYSP